METPSWKRTDGASRRIRIGLISLCALLVCTAGPVGAQVPRGGERSGAADAFPKTWEARLHYQTYVRAPLSRLPATRKHIYRQIEDGVAISFRVVRRGGSVIYLFLRENELGSFDLLSRGNTSIKRDAVSGRLEYMTVLLQDHPGCYARLSPVEGKTLLDIVFFGIQVHQAVSVPVRFDSLIAAPFRKVVELTGDRVRWDLLLGRGAPDPGLEALVEQVRSQLLNLSDLDDGAYSESGEPVFIETGTPSPGGVNCSGFAKWVVDGLHFALTGRYLDVEQLKERWPEHRGNRWTRRLEAERDLYFGLDWSRNLALAVHRARGGRVASDPEHLDVRSIPFLDYVEDIGYPVAALELLSFALALRSPGTLYMGSVSTEYGSSPSMRQHVHLVVLIPYFAADGRFRLAVFERGRETSVESLISRYGDDYIHLVSVRTSGGFQPMRF